MLRRQPSGERQVQRQQLAGDGEADGAERLAEPGLELDQVVGQRSRRVGRPAAIGNDEGLRTTLTSTAQRLDHGRRGRPFREDRDHPEALLDDRQRPVKKVGGPLRLRQQVGGLLDLQRDLGRRRSVQAAPDDHASSCAGHPAGRG
jgi:hypothetical protein